MRKGFFGKALFAICILFGFMVGYGFVQITGTGGETIYNRITKTKDNTLDREKDSVFFSSDGGNPDVTIMPTKTLQKNDTILDSITNELSIEDKLNEIEVTITINPTITPKPVEEAKKVEEKETIGQTLLLTPTQEQEVEKKQFLEDSKTNEETKQEEKVEIKEKEVSQNIVKEVEQKEIEEKELNVNKILAKGIKEKIENPSKEKEKKEKEMQESEMVTERTRENQKEIENEEKEIKNDTKVLEEVGNQSNVLEHSKKTESEQVITYPTEIFGQTPVVNRLDEYVTYFEFALDLIETVEAEVKTRGLSETALFAKFVVKALFCGVDVKTIKINEPISRSEAALALWLTAQVMEEADTSTGNGLSYITDLKNCSSSEKKAIAYLYEQGVISGYQVAGQTFFPSQHLRTKDGEAWMMKIKQCWK